MLPFDTSTISQNASPLKLFEYMACEKPVISTYLHGVQNAVGDHVIYGNKTIELKQIILKLYHNEHLRKELGENGKRFVAENYSWDSICHRLENILDELT